MHETLQLFALIASEVRRLESFEAQLPDELLHVQESIAAVSSVPLPVLMVLLDLAAMPARRLTVALGGWVDGLRKPARDYAVRQVKTATKELADVMAMLPSDGKPNQWPAALTPRSLESLSLKELAVDYAKDADAHDFAMVVLYLVTLTTLALAVAGAIWAAGGPDFAVSQFLARGTVVVVMLIGALAMIWQADRHRRTATEQRRIARQLRTLPAFIDAIDSPTMKDLMRGTVAARFFPRTLDDDDVLREPQWPDPDQLLLALEADEDAEEEG